MAVNEAHLDLPTNLLLTAYLSNFQKTSVADIGFDYKKEKYKMVVVGGNAVIYSVLDDAEIFRFHVDINSLRKAQSPLKTLLLSK